MYNLRARKRHRLRARVCEWVLNEGFLGEIILWASCSVISKCSVSTSTREQHPNHLPDENKLPHMKQKKGAHTHKWICSTSLTIAYPYLPAFNDHGTTRQASLCLTDTKKTQPFSGLENIYWLHHKRKINPLQCHILSIVMFWVQVIFCTQSRGRSKTCSLASAKTRGMHLPVNPKLSFFTCCPLIWSATAKAMFWEFSQRPS